MFEVEEEDNPLLKPIVDGFILKLLPGNPK
jgi:hypothetical protein